VPFLFGTSVAIYLGKFQRREILEAQTKYLTEQQVAKITSRALSTLRNERSKGLGIPYIKLGRSVRYDLQDVIEFMEAHKIRTDRYWRNR